MSSEKAYTPTLRSGRIYLLNLAYMLVICAASIFTLGISPLVPRLMFLGFGVFLYPLLSTRMMVGTLQCTITQEGMMASSTISQKIAWADPCRVTSMMGMIMVLSGSIFSLPVKYCVLPAKWLVRDVENYEAAIQTYAPPGHPLRKVLR